MKTRQSFVTLGPRKCPRLLEQVGKSLLLVCVCVPLYKILFQIFNEELHHEETSLRDAHRIT